MHSTPPRFAILAFCFPLPPAMPKVARLATAKRTSKNRWNLLELSESRTGFTGLPTEGGTLTFYKSGSSPRKLVAQYFGESGKATEEFYFRNNRLFLMRRLDSTYDRPYGKVVSTRQNEFYFANGKLQKESSEPKTPQREREILNDARELLCIAKAK